jgi:hypothetical protein
MKLFDLTAIKAMKTIAWSSGILIATEETGRAIEYR